MGDIHGIGGWAEAGLKLTTEERLGLERLVNRRKSAQALAMRARIVMLSAEGGTNRELPINSL
jgi:hypothetical protein